MDPLTIVIAVAVVALIVIAFVFTAKRNNKIKKEGIEANAVVSRIKEEENRDSDGNIDYSYTYYVAFQTQDGQTVEARLGNAPSRLRQGDSVRIKYLPEKPKFALMIK